MWYITYVMMMIPSRADVDGKGGGLCCVVESSGVAFDDRWFTLVTLPAGLVSWSSNVDTDEMCIRDRCNCLYDIFDKNNSGSV